MISRASTIWRDHYQTVAPVVITLVFFLSSSVWLEKQIYFLRWYFLVGITIVTVAIFFSRPSGNRISSDRAAALAAMCFLMACLLGAFFSENVWDSFQRALSFVILLVFSLAWAHLSSPQRAGRSLYKAMLVISVAFCLLGFVWPQPQTDYFRLAGTHDNAAGAVYGLGVIVFLLSYVFSQKGLGRIVLGGGCIGSVYLMAVTQSRGSILSCLVALTISAAILPQLRKTLIIVIVLGLLVVVATSLFPAPLSGTFDSVKEVALRADDSGDITTGRLASLGSAKWGNLIRSPIVGRGLSGDGEHPDGIIGELGYLSLLFKTGILGILGMFSWIAFVFRRLWRTCSDYVIAKSSDILCVAVAMTLFAYFALLSCAEGYVSGVGNAVTPLMWVIGVYGSSLGHDLVGPGHQYR